MAIHNFYFLNYLLFNFSFLASVVISFQSGSLDFALVLAFVGFLFP